MDPQKIDYTDPTNQAVKPGIYSSEFWICVGVVALGLLMQSGLLDDSNNTQHIILTIVGGVLQLAAALGFTLARAKVKIAAILGAVDLAKSQDSPPSDSTSETPESLPPASGS